MSVDTELEWFRDGEDPDPQAPAGGVARGRRLPVLPAATALFPLRLFLGLTFVYAGVQKLLDPGFLHAGAPTYVGTQLTQFASHTPGGFLLKAFALPFPGLAGFAVAITEIAVGMLVTVGLRTRAAAWVGLALNLLLFLTASWRTYPYFLGSDIIFVFAWLPLALGGADGQHSVDEAIARRAASAGSAPATMLGSESAEAATRRELIGRALTLAAAGTVLLAGIAEVLKPRYSAPTQIASPSPAGAGSAGSAGAPAPPQGAVRLGPASRLAPGSASTYTDPVDGQPDIVIRQPDGSLTAFSAVCTHAGCTVGYRSDTIACPCHGAEFNARTGAVVQGPAIAPLAAKQVVESGGDIYAVPS